LKKLQFRTKNQYGSSLENGRARLFDCNNQPTIRIHNMIERERVKGRRDIPFQRNSSQCIFIPDRYRNLGQDAYDCGSLDSGKRSDAIRAPEDSVEQSATETDANDWTLAF
jgi:hypothetical protein